MSAVGAMLVSAHDGGVDHHVLVVVIAGQGLENLLENAALGDLRGLARAHKTPRKLAERAEMILRSEGTGEETRGTREGEGNSVGCAP